MLKNNVLLRFSISSSVCIVGVAMTMADCSDTSSSTIGIGGLGGVGGIGGGGNSSGGGTTCSATR